MTFTKFYRRRLAILAVLTLCFLLSLMNSIFKHISDDFLEEVVINGQRKSQFNPRAMTYALLSYIEAESQSSDTIDVPGFAKLLSNNSGINFHWDDWVDLSPGNHYLESARKAHPGGLCGAGLIKFSQVNPYFIESYNTKISRGMINLYCVKDAPKRILVSTDHSFVEIPVTGKKRIGLEELSTVISKEQLEKLGSSVSINLESGKNKNNLKVIKYSRLRKNVHVSPQDFIFDVDKEILALKELLAAGLISQEEKNHLRFLEYSNSIVDSADRFFKYPWIYSDVVAGRSHHTSFPFFKRFISSKERQSVIQHMVRAWFTFSEASGIDSWVNYGSLLGWAYNGVNLPWDTDVDIQIPIAQLDRLSKRFNSTIITENPKYGNAKYLFEVSPTYPRHGNGRNFIDARFIEINTGLYIDISVLAHTTDQPPTSLLASLSEEEKLRAIPVHCKNWNWHLLDEILPLRQTLFESSPVYIPHNISSILSRKYGTDSFTSKVHFNGFHYDRQLSLWIPDKEDTSDCVFVQSVYGNCALSEDCKSNWVKDEFKIVHDTAEYHQTFDFDINYSAAVSYCPVFPLTRKDAFNYFEDIIEGRVATSDWFAGQHRE